MSDDLAQPVRVHPQTEPGRSVLAGHGLFASAPLPAGTAVLTAGDPPVLDALPVNHSCDPNLGWAGTDLITLRDVAAGEELSFDYATGSADPDLLVRCNCGSTRCRGLIEGDDWRIRELQRRYAGHWAPAVQRLIDELG